VPETPRVDSISRHEPCHAQPRRAGSVLLVLQRVRSSPTRATSEPAIVTVVPRGPGQPESSEQCRRPLACRTEILSAPPHGPVAKASISAGARPPAAEWIVHTSQVVPRIVLSDLSPELIYEASNARS
jgi:hypothetical protein